MIHKLILAATLSMALLLSACAGTGDQGYYGSPFIIKADKPKPVESDDES